MGVLMDRGGHLARLDGEQHFPTPMARWAKLMMAVQSLVALTTIALVFTRAVSLLN